MSLWIARLKYVAWKVLVLLLIGMIYMAVMSEGLRYLIPPLGQKLSRLPGLSALQDYEATFRLDLAHVMSVFVFVTVCHLWHKMLELWLGGDAAVDDHGWDPEAHRRLVVGLATVLLVADACLFYIGMTRVGWRGTRFSMSALLATATYVGVLIAVSFMSVNLRKDLRDLNQEK